MGQISITFTIPDANIQTIKDDFAAWQGWTAVIRNPDGPGTIQNPESQNAFIKRNIGEYIKDAVRKRRTQMVTNAAVAAELADENSSLILT